MIDGPLVLSIKLSAITTAILLVVGLPVAYWLAMARWRHRHWIEAVISLPLVLPPTVLGFYLLLLSGKNGALGQAWQAIAQRPLAFSFDGLILASVCYSLPFAVQPLQAAFEGLDRRLLEASWTLGASRIATFFRVVVPNCLPGLVAAAVLTFTHTLGEFGVVLMVGGNIQGETRTVSIAIYDMVEALDYEKAGRTSLRLLVLSYMVLLLFYMYNRKILQVWRHR